MNIRPFAYFFVVLILLNTGCKKKSDIEEQRYLWSTEDPVTIPLRLRTQRFEKGNLIRNPSFETGKIYKLDSIRSSFSIDGWQQVGRHIEWVDTDNDSLYTLDEAFAGNRAVKIIRESAYETDNEGDGILSDFIKVIPGNYRLNLYTRLENVKPNRARLGTRMFDGIEITVRFFDRNKNLIRSVFDYPIENQKIDPTFKGLSFANYKQVPSLGWSKITGKTHGFPFPEGDIPTEAHFVKIYIGLKGTGIIWIDSVSFAYTGRNFSVEERMQRFTDTSFHTPDILIPTPKYVQMKEAIRFATDDIKQPELPVILTGDPSLNNTAQMLKDGLAKMLPGGSIPTVVSSITDGQIEASRLVISIGNTSLYKRFEKELPIDSISGKPQGYFIYSPNEFPNLVILGAGNNEGLFNAALTAMQMIDRYRPYFHNALIIDYPDFTNRYCTFIPGIDLNQQIPELVRYKINGALLLNNVTLSGVEAPSVTLSGNVPMQSGVEGYFKISPVSGYVPPNPVSLSYDYPYTVRTDTALQQYGTYQFPQVFHNEMLDNSDYAEMCCQLPLSGKKLYSGSSFFSLNTDVADVLRFESIFGPSPVFMDNSMLISTRQARYGGNDPYYPGKIRLFNLFEPFGNTDIRGLYQFLDTTIMAVNLPPESEIEIIRLATAADFMWNMNSFSMDYSLWKVLVSRYGAQNAGDIVRYASQYSILLETIVKIEKNIQVPRNLKAGQTAITQITALTSEISARLGSQHRLIKALQQVNTNLRNRLNQNRSVIPAR